VTTTADPAQKLTPKGLATRGRIVEAAAGLMYERGVRGVNNDDVRRAAGVSGSQLSHYFRDKESLVRAVIAWRADRVVGLHRLPQASRLDSFEALRLWADCYLGCEEVRRGGCSYGSLAGEVIKTDPALREDLAAGFRRWEDLFRDGLRAMRARGDLRRTADPDHLADVLMAALQGGMLLTQAAQDMTPLRNALEGALAYIASFAARRSRTVRAERG
jgi:AcrR family transcriptional regulator